MLSTTPEISDSISFISFIDSMMHSTFPGCTFSPTRTNGGVLECAVEEEQQNEPCLTDAEIAALFAVGKNIERHYGKPQDIEWAISQEDEIFLLQSRPETVWSRRDATPVAKPARSALDHVFATFGGRTAP